MATSADFDFSNAQLPGLAPLEASYAVDAVEADLKQLLIDLFRDGVASRFFDANVLGAAHLGSFGLVQKIVNKDGLAILNTGGNLEAATRYLYRAWLSSDNQGRGAHFIRTYMQLLFPGEHEIIQLWQDKSAPYPELLYESEQPNSFLTSRFTIRGSNVNVLANINRLKKSILSCVPARFVINIAYNSAAEGGIGNFQSGIKIASIGYFSLNLDSNRISYQKPQPSTFRIVSLGRKINHITFNGEMN